jgi:hypothetical protein
VNFVIGLSTNSKVLIGIIAVSASSQYANNALAVKESYLKTMRIYSVYAIFATLSYRILSLSKIKT